MMVSLIFVVVVLTTPALVPFLVIGLGYSHVTEGN